MTTTTTTVAAAAAITITATAIAATATASVTMSATSGAASTSAMVYATTNFYQFLQSFYKCRSGRIHCTAHRVNQSQDVHPCGNGIIRIVTLW